MLLFLQAGFKKKVEKLGKKKGCEEVKGWIKSMVNHMYWCVMSSEEGDEQMILEKWKSHPQPSTDSVHISMD